MEGGIGKSMTFGGKIEKVYWAAKGLFISSAVLWAFVDFKPTKSLSDYILLFGTYIAINLVMFLLNIRRVIKGNNLLFSLFGFDTLFLGIAILLDGGAQSQLFIGYYVLIGMVSVYLSAKQVATVALVFSASYILVALPPFHLELLPAVLMRSFYIWLLGGIGYMIAYHMKASEKRVLKTLDTLNERTWELESSQALLENMYETTKALSAILDIDQLYEEVLEIADKILRVRKCAILLLEPSGKNLGLHAEVNSGKKTMYNPPLVISDIRPLELNSGFGEKGQTTYKKRPFELELPLVSHGKLLGMLQIEPNKQGEFSEKDRRSFTIFANSTAIAIDNAKMHKKMQDLTIIDELTGLYNYRFFRSKLVDEMRRADRYHQRMALLMIDIDHFKQLNDSQGHQTGNIVLQEISSVLKQSVRDVDIVARYGGEEFMVILPQTDIERAGVIAERIRSQIEIAYFSNSQGQRYLKVTVSVGVIAYPNGVLSTNQLLEKVDKTMYQAKKEGRNKVCMPPPVEPEAVSQES
jgi:diguanylate cyclase (GGDEF)-like protein